MRAGGRLRGLVLSLAAAVAGLFLGLAPGVLETGQLRPLDWLLPEGVVLAALCLAAGRGAGVGRMALHWALAALPPLLLCTLAATRLPWAEMLALAGLLALMAGALHWARARTRRTVAATMLLALAVLGGVQAAATMRSGSGGEAALARPPLGVMTALPLFRDRGAQAGLLDIGGRAPLLRALPFTSAPLDRLDADSLKAFEDLLLAQPRLLRPEELVALDDWVRNGGRVVILADPLLHWPDARPLGDPRRAPLTSLLDPLLAHWGLVLEPAEAGRHAPVTRRVLAGGALLQLAGASAFARSADGTCALEEEGFLARCRIGRGRALLVADADWVDDRLWTLDPARPDDARAWTSDAVPLLAALLRGETAAARPARAWLVSQEALISALRWALALILLLALALVRAVSNPSSTHDPPRRHGRTDRKSDGPSQDSG